MLRLQPWKGRPVGAVYIWDLIARFFRIEEIGPRKRVWTRTTLSRPCFCCFVGHLETLQPDIGGIFVEVIDKLGALLLELNDKVNDSG